MEKPYVIQEVKTKEPTKIPIKGFPTVIRLPRYNLEHMASYQQGNTLSPPLDTRNKHLQVCKGKGKNIFQHLAFIRH